MVFIKKIAPLIFVMLISVLALKPILSQGFFPMHDDTQPSRVYEMATSLRDGQFPVRWVQDLGYGYGYPIFNFYAPLPYYIGALGVIGGLGIMTATKLMFGLGFILAGITMYLLAQNIWGRIGAILCSLLFLYAPYHGVLLYVRGAIGELWAYAFLPLLVLGINVGKTHLKKGLVIGSLGLGGIILSHNISALIVIFLISLWLVVELIASLVKDRVSKYIVPLVIITFLGIGLSAFFSLPAFLEAGFTNVDQLAQGSNDYHSHFVDIDQLWDSQWGYGGSAPGRADGMSFKIGKVHLILAGLTLILFFSQRNIFKKYKSEVSLFVSGTLVSIFFMLAISAKFWGVLPFFDFIQYPWRFLTFATFFISIWCGGITGLRLNQSLKVVFTGLLLITIVGLNLKYFQPQFINDKTSENYISEPALKWTISKISDEYLPISFPIPKSISETAVNKTQTTDAIIVKSQDVVSNRNTFVISVLNQAQMVFNIAYFPGWKFVLDGDEITNPSVEKSRPILTIPPGDHVVTAYFTDTPIRIVGNMIAVISLLVLLTIALNIRYEKEEN